jgi:hypothetical protein
MKIVAYRHPCAPDCVSTNVHTYENAEELVLRSDAEKLAQDISNSNKELLTAVEMVLKADYLSTLTGGGSFMRHVPPTIQKLREAFTNYRDVNAEFGSSPVVEQTKDVQRG